MPLSWKVSPNFKITHLIKIIKKIGRNSKYYKEFA